MTETSYETVQMSYRLFQTIKPFNELRIIETVHMTRTVEDWSGVRSPSRTARRLRQGHRNKNIKILSVPRDDAFLDEKSGNLYIHPQKATELRRQLVEASRKLEEEFFFKGMNP